MRAHVISVNPRTGRVVADYNDGQRCQIDIISGDIELHDELVGDFESLGDQKIRNITQNTTVEVYIDDHT